MGREEGASRSLPLQALVFQPLSLPFVREVGENVRLAWTSRAFTVLEALTTFRYATVLPAFPLGIAVDRVKTCSSREQVNFRTLFS